MSGTTDLFIFYTYGNLIQLMILEINRISNNEVVNADTISQLQLFTSELKKEPGFDFGVIKDYLSEVNSTFALWVNSGKPEQSDLYLESVLNSLDEYLEILCSEYQTILFNKAGYNISFEEAYFILTGSSTESILPENNFIVKLFL
jgi:hypothetical protein